jgi:hypothetical protein
VAVDEEFALALHNMCGKRHDQQRAFFLCAKITGDEERAKGKQEKTC